MMDVAVAAKRTRRRRLLGGVGMCVWIVRKDEIYGESV